MTMEEDIVVKDTLRKGLVDKGFCDIRVACDSKTYTKLTKRQVLFCIAAWRGEMYYIYGNAVCKAGESSKLTSVSLISALDLAAEDTSHLKKVHLDYIPFTNEYNSLQNELQKFIDIL